MRGRRPGSDRGRFCFCVFFGAGWELLVCPLDIRLRDGKFQGRRCMSACAQAIAEGLADHKDLRKLSLGKNGFGDAGTQAWS